MGELDKPFKPTGSFENALIRKAPTADQQRRKIEQANKLKKQQEENRRKAGN